VGNLADVLGPLGGSAAAPLLTIASPQMPIAGRLDWFGEDSSSSLVTRGKGNAHKGGVKCESGPLFQEICGDGHWKWRRVPCDKWACEACHRRRFKTELIPEIVKALEWARDLGETLKHVVLTYQSEDVAAAVTPAGAHRRKLDLQHLAQWFRRQGMPFEYFRVAETHKSGRVHSHLLVIMPYVRQETLSEKWKDFARGSFRVSINAVGMKCPRCYPGAKASWKDKRRSMIFPPPGKGECSICGYTPDWSQPFTWDEIATASAWEAGKYLSKEFVQSDDFTSRVRKLNRSKGWRDRCQVIREKGGKVCESCGDEHRYVYIGNAGEVSAAFPGVDGAGGEGELLYYPYSGHPCDCWSDGVWVESRTDCDNGLTDLLYSAGHFGRFRSWQLVRDGPS